MSNPRKEYIRQDDGSIAIVDYFTDQTIVMTPGEIEDLLSFQRSNLQSTEVNDSSEK